MEGGGEKPPVGFKSCPKCGHSYIDQPPSNKVGQAMDDAALAHHTKLMDQWKQFSNGEGPAPIDSTGKVLTKPPSVPKTHPPILCCHCHQF